MFVTRINVSVVFFSASTLPAFVCNVWLLCQINENVKFILDLGKSSMTKKSYIKVHLLAFFWSKLHLLRKTFRELFFK